MPDFPWPQETGIWHTYDFHCHCGAIRWNMKISPPLYAEHAQNKAVYKGIECTCSYCERSGYISCHPKASNVTFTQGLSSREEYLMGNKIAPHWFCKNCASNIGADLSKLMEMSGGLEARYLINLRMLKDYDRSKLTIRQETAMKDMPPKYSVD